MRRLSGGRAKEISLTKAGANRRLIAMYKSAAKPPQETMPMPNGSPANLTRQQAEDAIANPDANIFAAIKQLAKSVGDDGKSNYTPQAASIVKAVGRLLAPFSEELTLADLQKVGKAAGLGSKAGEAEELSKSAKDENKDSDDDEFEEDELADDEEEEDDSEDDAEDSDTVNDEEDTEPADKLKKSSGKDVAPHQEISQSLNKAADSEDSDEEEEEEEAEAKTSRKGTPPWTKGRATKDGKGGKMAKTANQAETESDKRIAEVMAKHAKMEEENKLLREEMAKSRKDLDDERNERQLETMKKSIKADYPHIGGIDVDKLAPLLKSAKDNKDQAGYEYLTTLLKSCDDQVRSAHEAGGIFKTLGKSAGATDTGASWESRIEARVHEEMKKSADKRHFAQCYSDFVQTDEGRKMLLQSRNEKRSY